MGVTPIYNISYPDGTTRVIDLPTALHDEAYSIEAALTAFGMPPVISGTPIVAASSAARDLYWGVPSTASARRALQNLGAEAIRTDTGITERYYAGLTDGGANPGGKAVAGWYNIQAVSAGLTQVIPSSISGILGGAATIGGDGRVTLAACTGFTMNGLFDASADHYLIKESGDWSANQWWNRQLSVAGAANTAAVYDIQRLTGIGAAAAAVAQLAQVTWQSPIGTGYVHQWLDLELFNPFISGPTRGFADGGETDGAGNLAKITQMLYHRNAIIADGITYSRATAANTYTGTIDIFKFSK